MSEMNLFDFIILGGSMLMLTFALHLFVYSQGNLLLNKLLGILFLMRALQNLFFFFISIKDSLVAITFFSGTSVFMFLVPPAVYLYLRAFIHDQSKLGVKDALHLIPMTLAFLNMLPFYFASTSIKEELFNQSLLTNTSGFSVGVLLVPIRIQFIIRSVILVIYLLLSWNLFFKALSDSTHRLYSEGKHQLQLFLLLITLQCLFSFLGAFIVILNNSSVEVLFSNLLLMSIVSLFMITFIFWILRHPGILYGNLISAQNGENKSIVDNAQNDMLSFENTLSSEPRFLLSEQEIESQLTMLDNLMKHKKPYLDPEFNLQSLSDLMGKPVHHCSYLLNQVIKKSFRDYLNGYRVSHFLTLYAQNANILTIEYLANEGGFRNRSTFNIAFKKETGYTPTEYFKLHNSK